jgi:hypothetical protein
MPSKGLLGPMLTTRGLLSSNHQSWGSPRAWLKRFSPWRNIDERFDAR